MAVAWPGDLPQAPTSFSEQGSPTAIHTQPDSGPTKTRRRFTKAKSQAKMSFLLTIENWLILKNFFENTLAGGSITMLFTHPWTQVTTEMKVTEPPSAQNEDTLGVRVNLTVEYF